MYGIIFNPISGRGIGRDYADQISKYFLSRGEKVLVRESSPHGSDLEFLKSISGLVVIGGDGTIRPYLPHLARSKIPVILFPAGNESLIAQQFLVDRDIPSLFERIKKNEPTDHYYGIANGEPFFLMCSVGFDAEVVEWVKKKRKDFSSNFLYLKAVMRVVFKGTCQYRIEREGETKVFSGSVIIANSPYYAARLSPVADASSSEASLRYSIFQGSYMLQVFKFIFMRLGIFSSNSSGPVGTLFLSSEDDNRFIAQIDGDSLGSIDSLKVSVSRDSVRFY